MAEKTLYPWKRFWRPEGLKVSCGNNGEGFLNDPEKKWLWSYNDKCRSLPDLVSQNQLLVLCGPPGSGKTTELKRLENDLAKVEGFEVISRKASAVGPASPLPDISVRSKSWKKALKSGKGILFLLDGLDEALQREQTLLDALIELLKSEPLEMIRVILTCRSAQWLPECGQELARLWKTEDSEFVYELCPLRYSDVEVALEIEIAGRQDNFFEEVSRCEAVPLARWPITFNMLIEQFRDAEELPASRGELYRRAVERLVEEWNPSRERLLRSTEPDWVPGEKIFLARRIAAMMVFSGKKALLRCDHTHDPDCLSYTDVIGADGIIDVSSERQTQITRFKIDRITETRLFETTALASADSGQAVKFTHLTFAELLAGEFVAGLGVDELRRLFFIMQPCEEERIPPQLLQTAAWLAGTSSETKFFELLLSLHPEALLNADLSPFSDNQKARIVSALIAKAVDGDPGPERAASKASYSLRFQGIADLLRPVILDVRHHVYARRFALSLARICHVPELGESVWVILERPDDPVKKDAAYTLSIVENDPSRWKYRLQELAKGKLGNDPDDTMRGRALQLLVPRCIPLRDVLGWISLPKREYYLGAYQSFLTYDAPKIVSLKDLPACLNFLISNPGCYDSLSPYEGLAIRVFDLACENLDRPGIADQIVKLWLVNAREYSPLPRSSEPANSYGGFPHAKSCRATVQSILNHQDVTRENLFYVFDLISAVGLGYLLKNFADAVQDRREIWALGIRHASKPEARKELRGLLQQKYNEFKEIRLVFPSIQKPGLDLHDTLRRYEKAGDLILKRRQKQNFERNQRLRKSSPTWADVFDSGLCDCRSGRSGGWINLSQGIVGDSDKVDLAKNGMEASELFLQQSAADQQLIRECSRGFLFDYSDERSDQQSRTNWSEAAYRAISWSRDEIVNDSKLHGAVGEKWIGAIIDTFNNGEEEHQALVSLAYKWNPEKARQWLEIQLNRQLNKKGEGWLLDLRAFETTWDRQLSMILADFLENSKIKPASIRDGLRHLLKHDQEFANKLLLSHLESISTEDPRLSKGVNRAVAAVTLFYSKGHLRDVVWPLISGNRQSAERLLLENIPEFERDERKLLDDMKSSHVLDLLLLVYGLFHPDNDPPLNQSSTVTPIDECIRLRRNAIQVLTRRGEIKSIQRFLDSLPQNEADVYRWNLDEAKQNRALIDWTPQQPQEITRLAQINHGTLIRNDRDLLEVVIASLSRFQDDLQAHHIHRVWDGNSPKHEEFVSKEIADWLKSDLNRIAVNREVEVNRWNERVDIKIEAFPYGNDTATPLTLIIETKRAQNREIPESIETQLIDKYLKPNLGWECGIYLVAWFHTEGRWEEKQYLESKTPKEAAFELESLCETATAKNGVSVRSFVLDCSFGSRTSRDE